MENLIAQPWFQQLIDSWLMLQERLEELPWQIASEWLSRFIFLLPLADGLSMMLGGLDLFPALGAQAWQRPFGLTCII